MPSKISISTDRPLDFGNDTGFASQDDSDDDAEPGDNSTDGERDIPDEDEEDFRPGFSDDYVEFDDRSGEE